MSVDGWVKRDADVTYALESFDKKRPQDFVKQVLLKRFPAGWALIERGEKNVISVSGAQTGFGLKADRAIAEIVWLVSNRALQLLDGAFSRQRSPQFGLRLGLGEGFPEHSAATQEQK